MNTSSFRYMRIFLFFWTGMFIIAWGYRVHKIINENAPAFLPSEMTAFIQRAVFFGQHATDADNRKNTDPNESPKHYIDIDDYQEYVNGSFPHEYNDALQTFGAARLNDNGILPWAIEHTVDSVSISLKRGDWERAFLHCADLGHYVGDLSQPLHLTKNYDGQFTDNSGIHSRYETKMIEKYYSFIHIVPRSVQSVPNVLDSVFTKIDRGLSFVKPILDADNAAIAMSGKNNYNDQYYTLLWNMVSSFTRQQMEDASRFFAELMYTAWIRAGKPEITSVALHQLRQAYSDEIMIESVSPHPANRATSISISVKERSFLAIRILNNKGSLVTVLASGTYEPGLYSFVVHIQSLPSGIYFCIVQTLTGHQIKPIVIYH